MIHFIKLFLYLFFAIISFALWKKEKDHSRSIIILAAFYFLVELILNVVSFPAPKIILDRIDTVKQENPTGLLIHPSIKNTGNIKAENIETTITYKLGDEILADITEKQVDIHEDQKFFLGRFEAGPNTYSKIMEADSPLNIEIHVNYSGPKVYFWQKEDATFEARFEKNLKSPFGSWRMLIIKNE